MQTPARRSQSTLSAQLAELNPAYFALVMATGIVSVACSLSDFHLLAETLFWFNVAAFAWLVVATALRIVFFPCSRDV